MDEQMKIHYSIVNQTNNAIHMRLHININHNITWIKTCSVIVLTILRRISPTSLIIGLSRRLFFMALLNLTWISSSSLRFGKMRFNSSDFRHCLLDKGFIKTVSSTLRFLTCDLSVWNNSEKWHSINFCTINNVVYYVLRTIDNVL